MWAGWDECKVWGYGMILTVDDAFRVQDGLVYDFGAPDEGCAVFEGGQPSWYCDASSAV